MIHINDYYIILDRVNMENEMSYAKNTDDPDNSTIGPYDKNKWDIA